MSVRAASCQETNTFCAGECDRDAASLTPTDLSVMMIAALGRALEARDPATHRHAERVERYAMALARENAIEAPR